MKNFLIITSLVSLGFLSCGKSNDPTPSGPTKADYLAASAWKLDAAGIDADRNGTIDQTIMSLLPTCTVDNSITFKKDNTGTTDEGATKCNTTDPQTTPLNWSFADGETYINVSNSVLGQINGKSKILILTTTALSLTKDTVVSGSSYALVVNLKH